MSLLDSFKYRLATELTGEGEYVEDEFVDPDPIRWITTHFYIPETNSPIPLHESQIIPLREALSRDENGLFRYSNVLWGSNKKSAKSCIAAAVCLWMAWQKPWRSVKIVAHDLKQADSRVAYYARRACLLHPRWREIVKLRNYKIILPNHSVIEAIPVDPEGEAGGNDDFVSYTEIWSWRGKAYERMWTETTLSPVKYGHSLRWMDTYAGFTGESLVLERMYNAGVKEGVCINPEYEMYKNEASRLFVLWNTKPRLPYQTPEYYAQEAATLVASEFNRVHKNEWQSSENQFVPYEWWEACAGDYPPPAPNQACVVALDAAVSGDCFGIVMVSAIPGKDGHYGVQYARKWTPPKGQKLIFRNGDGPEDELRRLLTTYNIIEVAYDPFQLEDMASRLNVDLLARMYAFSQANERLMADKRLYDMIRERTIHHKNDPDLNEHIKNANQQVQGENKIRIVKRSELLKIDLAVSLSMALERAVFWQI